MLIFIKFTKTMRVASKFIRVDVPHNQYIASKFIGVDAVWLGECLPPQNLNEKLA